VIGVVVDAAGGAVGVGAPEELIRRDGGEGRIRFSAVDPGDRGVDVAVVEERARALDEDGDLGAEPVDGPQDVQRVQECGFRGGVVTAEVGRPVDDTGALGAREGCDGVVVGADDDEVDRFRRLAGADRTHHQRNAADLGEVLARHAFGPTACRDDRDRCHDADFSPAEQAKDERTVSCRRSVGDA